MKSSSDSIGKRTRDLPACSAVPQLTATPRTPTTAVLTLILLSSELLPTVGCLSIDVSGQPISRSFIGQLCPRRHLALEDGTDRLSLNVGA
jgi:hypothetical protein